ncbi:hypothetical protein B0H14DRAFT_3097002 [Mycena olivaceomarginata]|nr:hypothetical protein B0H14DRAFT_3097002 [Mycena olivaceomarginata]
MDLDLDPQVKGIVSALILHGLMPCAPWSPTMAVRARVLEAYRVTHVRCPHLAIQAFVKSFCDMHGLKGEDALIFDMLTTMDGNDSLKRVLRRDKSSVVEDETGEPTLAKSSERVDNRDASDGYYISHKRVDRWARSRLGDKLPMDQTSTDEDNPCADRWKNMINNVTSKMWGIFDETGIFLALCRHGFVLVIADMIKSGELAKYLLGVVKELLDVFGMKLGAGYNVGCHFQATVANSELADEAKDKKLKCLVGSFHGHAHNRLCQLRFLATYVEGMGLEDLEGCEQFFSRSNRLAKSCRYASRFHRQQEITTYAKHFDSFETYANLSKFLCNNYRQALTILKTEPALRVWMRQEGIASVQTFHDWLEEEKTAKYQVVAAEARRARGGTRETPCTGEVETDLEQVQGLESALDIVERWTATSPKWVQTVAEIKKRKYQLALDALELLIVERIFELTKMNQSETGYKMRKHIAKALQACSKAVKNAIDRYNDAAAMLEPPMPKLTWEKVVEYAFLADFDILRDTRAETLRAREEIKRLDIEIQRVVTWIRDKNRFLRRMEAKLRDRTGKTEE